jgi:hypothetical protein
MKRGWSRRDGIWIITAAAWLMVLDFLATIYGARTLIPLITRLGAQVVSIAGIVLSLATFLFGLYVLTGRLTAKSN